MTVLTPPGRVRRRARKGARDSGFIFEAEPRTRICHRFVWIQAHRPDGHCMWWIGNCNTWVQDYRDDERWRAGGTSSSADCRTLRAFRSHLRRHREELAGCTVTLCSRFIGHNVTVQL